MWHRMFTIEHEFAATIVTLVDEGSADRPPGPDVAVSIYEDEVILTQDDPMDPDGPGMTVRFSLAQLRDLGAALDLPEGAYRIARPKA